MTLYGQIPFLLAHGLVRTQPVSAGIFWFNPTETFVDISEAAAVGQSVYKQSHWMSETGDVDVFLFAGPSLSAVYRQYTSLVGTQQLPPIFSLGKRDYESMTDCHSLPLTLTDSDWHSLAIIDFD